ncbi:MAG: complex I NDUFA9 subunit family protein [Burkholderiaceae bacterium]
MRYPSLLVIGGTGFIGQRLVSRLSGDNYDIVVPTKRRRHGRDLFLLPKVQVVTTDIHDDAQLDPLIEAADAVINLVGVLHSSAPVDDAAYGPEFAKAHVELPQRIATACARYGKRLVHISALGADPERAQLPSGYLRSKADGERAIAASGLKEFTVLRPSVVFGPGDKFLNMFATLQQFFPVMPLARGGAQLQPVFVGDLVTAIVNVLNNVLTFGRAYEVAGPEIFTLRELVALAGEYSGHPRKIIDLPDAAGRLQARALELAPGPTLMSRDNFDSLAKPNIATGPLAPELGITPASLTAIGPTYLRHRTSAFNEERARARR